MITSAMLDLGLDTLTGGHRAFLNVTGSLVIEQIDALVPPDDVVLELLETIEVTEDLIAACRKLKAKGYVLALDDFVGGSAAEAGRVRADVPDSWRRGRTAALTYACCSWGGAPGSAGDKPERHSKRIPR